ncbi:MAG TPA: hypothetical protein VIG08_06460 [Gemmatimonadales bacterium]
MTDTARFQQLYSGRVTRRAGDGPFHAAPEAILALIQREGSENERLLTLEHVMACADCHREYEWLRAVNEAGIEAGGERAADAPRKWWTRTGPLALAASLVLAIGAALLMTKRGNDLERGDTGDIELIAPAAAVAAGHPLVFVWHPLAGASRYVLEVQRRDGSVAYSDSTTDTIVSIPEPARVLPESEYRWWVRETTDGAEPRSSALRPLRLSR